VLLRARELRAPRRRRPHVGTVVTACGPVAAAIAVCLVVRLVVRAPDIVVLALAGGGSAAAYLAVLGAAARSGARGRTP
jgi:hypothetical protein